MILLAALFILIHDGPHWAQLSPELRQWFSTVKNQSGVLCCSEADGWPINGKDVQWDTETKRYRVFREGVWYEVGDAQLVTEPNRVGHPVVWWGIDANSKLAVRCFLPGAGL